MRGLGFLRIAAIAALILAAGWAAWTVFDRDLLHLRRGAEAEAAAAYRAEIKDIRSRLKAGEKIRLIVRLKMSYRRADGKLVPPEELERAKAKLLERFAGPGIESARSIPNVTALSVIVTSVAGLNRVLSDSMVERVMEDIALEPLVNESRVILHATLPWNDDGNGLEYTGAGFAVAIIDTGVDSSTTTGLNVVAEACYSSNLCGPLASPGPMQGPGTAQPCSFGAVCGHGTLVAGVAVGRSSFPGIAPGARIVAIQAASKGSGDDVFFNTSNVLSALMFAAYYNSGLTTYGAPAHPIVSVNLSLGGGSSSGSCGSITEVQTLNSLGISVVAASGNGGRTTGITWPACLNGVVSVGATNKWDVVAKFTDTDASLDLLAPSSTNAVSQGGGIGGFGGTSNAAPHVAGCVALLAQEASALTLPAVPLNPATPGIFETAMKATGIPVTDWRDYSLTKPRVDCGAVLWNLRGDNHLAKIEGTVWDDVDKDRANGTSEQQLGGWLVEAFSVGPEPWPPYVGHPSYSAVTVNGYYKIEVPWGRYRLRLSPYGSVPAPTAGYTDHWKQTTPDPADIDVNPLSMPGSMGPFSGNDFGIAKEDFCPSGQDYRVFVADRRDHYTMPPDAASPDGGLQKFFSDRYSPDPPKRMETDEHNWSTRPFIHTFDLSGLLPSHRIMKAVFDVGARPVVRPDPIYPVPPLLERNDAVWLLFPDQNGGLLGNPTAWGRGVGAGSLIGTGLLATDWDYPTEQVRHEFSFSLPSLPLGAGVPLYIDGDIRPMIDQHRKVGLFFQDDTGVDYAAMHVCSRPPQISITKASTEQEQEFDTGDPTTLDLTVTNNGSPLPPSPGATLQVSDELPAGFDFSPTLAPGTHTFTGGADWPCVATVGDPGGSKFVCTYAGSGLANSVSTTIHVPVTAALAGTHQNCASVDVIENGEIIDHASACSVNAVGHDIGVRKRKDKYMIRWDDETSTQIDDPLTFTLEVRNFGQSLDLSPTTIAVEDKVLHSGFGYGGKSASGAWTCNAANALPLDFSCAYNGAGLTPSGIVPPGYDHMPIGSLDLERGFPLPTVDLVIRGNETGWWENCAKTVLSGYADEITANDDWCVWIFVQGNIEVVKEAGHADGEYDFDTPSDPGQSELIDFIISVSNWAGRIDAPLDVRIDDFLWVTGGFTLDTNSDSVSEFAGLNPAWDCPIVSNPGSSNPGGITCFYRPSLPVPGATPSPLTAQALTAIKLNLRAAKPGFYENCAEGDIVEGPPPPIDDQPDEITPPDPPGVKIDTDFYRTNNKGCAKIVVGHDVGMTKTASTVRPHAGDTFTYDVQFANYLSSIGPNEQLHFTDPLPPGFTRGALPPGPGPGVWDCSASTSTFVDCAFDTGTAVYPAGAAFPPLSIPVVAPLTAGAYTNCADLDLKLAVYNDEDDVLANNHSCVTITVPAHLSITKTSDQSEYNLNDQITFTLTVTNPAPGSPGWGSIIPAGSINFADVLTNLANGLPAGLTLVYANWPNTWGCLPGSWTCTPTVPINAPDAFTFTIVVDASIPGHFNNCFNLTLNGAPNIGPTSDCVDFYVGHDVSISKSVDNSAPQNKTNVTFTLAVSNNLSSVAPPETIVVTDILPPGLTPDWGSLAANNPPWNCQLTFPPNVPVGQSTVECTYVGSAPAGSPLPSITFQALVGAWGPLNNCATVDLVGVTDDIPANNGPACASVQVPESYLKIEKVYVDQTGGTPESSLPSTYTTTGFPIELSCSSFPGMIPVPIKPGYFSTNDPSLATNPPTGWTSMTPGPSTVPTVPGTTCLISEAALPPIRNVAACQNGSASWTTTYDVNGTTVTTANVTMTAGQTSSVRVTNTLKCDYGYLAIYKVYDDQTGGTPESSLPSVYTTTGFLIQLSCSSFPGTIPVPIRPGFFSSNDPVLTTTGDPTHSMTVGPSTVPTVAGTSCLISEATLPPISGLKACGGEKSSASWSTTYLANGVQTFTDASVTIASGQTSTVTVKNTLKCDMGGLQFNKIISNPTWPPGTTFTFQYACTHPNPALNFSGNTAPITPGTGWSIPVPNGSNCNITEPMLPPPFPRGDETCTWYQAAPTSQSVTTSGALTGVDVKNYYTCRIDQPAVE